MLKLLKDEEWGTLLGLEKASMTYGFADVGMVHRLSGLPRERVSFAMDKLERKGLVMKRGQNYVLNREAVEALALREYVKKDLIAALGAPIGKGKESDVYEALSEEGTKYALKFFKLGRISFTRVRKKRFIEKSDLRSWITVNYEAAKKEYTALKALRGLSDAFPVALVSNRSTVLLEELSGVRLSQRPELGDPRALMIDVLTAARVAFVKAGLINADLSEYNVLTDGLRVWIIDWPQAVPASHPNARELLERDVKVTVKFFNRAYGVEVDEAKAVGYVSGKVDSLE